MNAIETAGLTKYYGKARGILDVNLTVAQGEVFGFIGPNGAGKSTTIRTLLGLIAPSAGSASLLGRDIRQARATVLSDIGYMPSEAMFYGQMRVREVIRLSARLRRRDCTAEAAALCERLALDTGKRIEELSLGNRKKVSIVCALQHRPALYIFDEPTSGLDPLMQKAFFDLLEERHKAGATIFLSSHVLSEIQRYCDRAAIIREGRLIACDTVEALARTSAKKVTLHGMNELPPLDGARGVSVGANQVSFHYQGDLHRLLQALSGLPFDDLTIAESSLEEIFLHYYTAEEAKT